MRRTWFIAAIVLAIGAVAIVVLVVRLTEDGNPQTSPAVWADSVCASLSSWRSSITSLADVSGGTLTPESLREKLDEAQGATSELVVRLRELGPPGVANGGEVEQALDDAVAGLQRSYESLQAAASDAATARDRDDFIRALALLGDDFQSLLTQVQDTVATLRSASLFGEASAELELAFADADSCRQLRVES
ncbi:MAG TPA: hypothetical protein VFR38_04955 [Gaiellaceae bacterium]|nr:hypothetical protein [Gaiellaceae bacterium]